jgi:hypothetical protein
MWSIMMAGPRPFLLDEDFNLWLQFAPAIPSWLFTDEGRAALASCVCHMYAICMLYVCYMYAICMLYVCYMYASICVQHATDVRAYS